MYKTKIMIFILVC